MMHVGCVKTKTVINIILLCSFFSLFQCHALISDGSLALCTALEQFNLVYLKNKLYEGKLPYWLHLK